MPKKRKKQRTFIEHEKINKASHCRGKVCDRFKIFRQSCIRAACYYINLEIIRLSVVETLQKIVDKKIDS